MPIKTLALVIFDSEEAPWLIARAAAMAAALDAHFIALHPYTPMIYFDGLGADPMIYASVREWEEQESEKIRAIFDKEVKANGLLAEFRRHSALYGTEAFILSSTRAADLVVVGTNGSQTRSPDDCNLLERMIRNLGRPVLVLTPEAALEGGAERIVMGWSDTREATRAAHDALALARSGAEIQLVSVISRAADAVPGLDSKDDFATALDRLGYKVSVSERNATADNRGETLIGAAQDFGADLLVAGAFGHSQLYDFVIGAVTRDLLYKSPLPVLLSK
ncbi:MULTISPECIES: universal stress protein [Salipiger]|jgi:nucleotide-binding universal stress UspA family protein|uniref:Universal stress protein UspA-like protein n=1 Tax=Salipiger profundus TaxID=1229727 RepID=A0A1U7D6G6_9RHOB|nr:MULTISPECIES: universal stress protein [Salipiger]APX23650.1 universal stress protein UspA-like protein [Salipiger profundus]GGA16961.1 universal stress protein [Salipiger profundus]SFD32770.1 Nucleotide-binding universal stress protein, UspA family [Salipiger profundus]